MGGRLVDSCRATIAYIISDWVTGFIKKLVSSTAEAGDSIAQDLLGSVGGASGGGGADIAGGISSVTSGLASMANPINMISGAVTAIASVAQLFKKQGPSSTDSWHFEHIWINAKEIRDYMYLVQRNWLTKEIPERISHGNKKLDRVNSILRDIRGNTADTVNAINAIPGGQHGLDFQSGSSGGLVRYHPNEKVKIQPNFSASVNVSATPINNVTNLYIADRHIMEVVKRNSVEWSTHHGLKFNRRGLVGS